MADTGLVKLGNLCQVGIAVKDADKVIEAWSSAFGFSDWRSQEIGGIDAKGRSWKARIVISQFGSMSFELIQPLEGRIAQSRLLETYGEGIHHLQFPVANLAEETARLEGRPGFRVVLKTDRFSYIEVPGGVTIELVPPRSNVGKPISAGIVKLGEICQVGIAVKDAEKVIEAWSSAFGFSNWRFTEMGGVRENGSSWKNKLVFSQHGPIDFEFIQPMEGRVAQSRLLETRGDGIHHIAFRVSNVAEETAKLEGRPGFRVVVKMERLSYIEVPGGVTIQLLPLRR